MQQELVPARRFPLLATTRWLVPVAIAFGLVGAAVADGARARALFLGGTGLVAALWAVGRWRRPLLVVDDEGYQVVIAGRERLRVGFAEVVRARAVPTEQAMYLDCGDPKRNLLLPTRHGYGFRFARQPELYMLLAKRVADRLEIADRLIE